MKLILSLILGLFAWKTATAGESQLPWPPTEAVLEQVAKEFRCSLSRSPVPEARKLLAALPSYTGAGKRIESTNRIYWGGWKVYEDRSTLWTSRIRNQFIRHTYEVRFKKLESGLPRI